MFPPPLKQTGRKRCRKSAAWWSISSDAPTNVMPELLILQSLFMTVQESLLCIHIRHLCGCLLLYRKSLFCSAGGPKLKCAELLSHVVEVLQSSFSCAAYGEDYSSILLKNILSVRKYWCEMSQQQWHSECKTRVTSLFVYLFIYVNFHFWVNFPLSFSLRFLYWTLKH